MREIAKKSMITKEKVGANELELTTFGFTLIELLAVIIILGVLMLIAIPSVTEYISNSRKSAYITTANKYTDAVMAKVNSLELPFTNMNVTYYVPVQCINLEKGGKSPYGDWDQAYVVVVLNGNSYDYYWTSTDKAHMGVNLIKTNDLTKDMVIPNVASIDTNVTIGGRTQIGLIDKDTCSTTPAISYTSGNVPIGTLASKVAVGDFVNYDAGIWNATVPIPSASEPFAFGGYSKGESRNKSVICEHSTIKNGWQVLSKTVDTVTLIHAGQSECYFHPLGTNTPYTSEKILTGNTTGIVSDSTKIPRDFGIYVNSNYATSATVFTKAMLDDLVGSEVVEGGTPSDSYNIIHINSSYWLASAINNMLLWHVVKDKRASQAANHYFGIRPVVTLKAGVLTSGQGTDSFGNTAWKLTQ